MSSDDIDTNGAPQRISNWQIWQKLADLEKQMGILVERQQFAATTAEQIRQVASEAHARTNAIERRMDLIEIELRGVKERETQEQARDNRKAEVQWSKKGLLYSVVGGFLTLGVAAPIWDHVLTHWTF